ncbi:MAG: hypothetical protein K2Z81_12550 [Cyanobacteria bacterium]|nr:hypothetical protein [Cyanobacteriota bacterium]
MSDQRSAAKNLANMMLGLKDYGSAAVVISGCDGAFTSCSAEIRQRVEQLKVEPSETAITALKQVLEKAREEIRDHEKWEQEIFSMVSQDDQQVAPLKQAFSASAIARNKLLQEVSEASNFLEA